MDLSPLPYNVQMSNSWKVAMAEFRPKMTPEIKKECWDIINAYLRKISKDKIPNVLSVERSFSLQISDNIFLNGAIDRVQLDDDNVIHVADYKTTKNKSYLKKDDLQLKTYGYILVSENPDIEKVRVSYILLRHDFEEITFEFSRKELLKIKQQFVDYANNMMNEKEFEANPSKLCGWCDYLEHCEEGREKVNSDKSQSHKVYGEVGY
jgi:RecB family exonuclease